MKVEIYDQYKDIYLDSATNKLTEVNTVVGQPIDTSRYTLIHSGVGSTILLKDNVDFDEAVNIVTNVYIESQSLGISYDDKLLKLNEGYAELLVNFEDGKILNRVIYIRQ